MASKHGKSRGKHRKSSQRSDNPSGFSKNTSRFHGKKPGSRSGPTPVPAKQGAALKEALGQTHQQLRQYAEQSRQLRLDRQSQKTTEDPHQLDPWQEEAVNALQEGANVIVDAPTTAGKTRVVETYFHQNLHDPKFRACYTTPVKSLSNDKLKEFRAMFGHDLVGIATGDIKENLGAPIVVATLESYRNSLLGVEPDLGRTLVVFDEYHFLQDASRGSAWEEAMILTPESCQILMLSASAANPEEFAAWLEKLGRRSSRLVRVTHRPVPLVDLVFYGEQWLLKDTFKMPAVDKGDPLFRFPLDPPELARRVKDLPRLGLTPCIVYCGQRRSCELLASAIAKDLTPLTEEESQKLKDYLARPELAHADQFLRGGLKKLILTYGVGFHHSGMAPPARILVEDLVKGGMLKFCVATMGLSIGINFSVRSSLIADYRRPGEAGFVQYSASEVLQMLGRAGRRGRDVVGFSLWPSVPAFRKLGEPKREKCDSRLRNDPTTFLGLMGRGFSLKNIETFYNKSFMRFRDRAVDLSVIRPERVLEKLNTKSLCCISPAHEFALFIDEDKKSKCWGCHLRKDCHNFIEQKLQGSLSSLHLHLHLIGCVDEHERLTDYGSIARYLPQSGGLLLARLLAEKTVNAENLMTAAQLMACLALARFKEPNVPRSYEFPFEEEVVEEELERLYPYELFEELYDPQQRHRNYPVIREFNPAAGYIVAEWLQGCTWEDLTRRVTTEKFGQGDVMALLYRTATYLQSIRQAKIPEVSKAADYLWRELMRAPLVVNESLTTSTVEVEEADEPAEPSTFEVPDIASTEDLP